MFRRRKSPAKTKKTPRYIHRCAPIEQLEDRTMLFTLNAAGGFDQMEYKDADGDIVRVVASGLTAELVFGRVVPGAISPQRVVLGEPVPEGTNEDGHDLYHIFIQQSSIDAYIAISEIQTSGARPMTPFSGSVNLRIISQATGDFATVDMGNGGVYIGARQVQLPQSNIQELPDQPILSAPFKGLGIMPATKNGKLIPGLSMAPGQDLGRFLLGGTISGNVYVPSGSIETFYAGNVLTGNTHGQFLGDPEVPENFFVNGELRNLLVLGNIGTEDDLNTGNPDLVTQPVIHVTGRSDMIRTGGNNLSYIRVDNRNDVPRIRALQREIESKQPTFGGLHPFEDGLLGDNEFFDNDSPNIAGQGNGPQFLGTFDSRKLGADVIQVQGEIDNTFFQTNPEVADYYGIGLIAGQTITLRLISDQGSHVGIIDPDGNLVASDYDNNLIRLPVDPQNEGTPADVSSALTNKPWQFTAKKPGIYKIAIGRSDGVTFDVGFPLGFFAPYQLQVTNLGNVGLGGIAVGNELFNDTNTISLVPVPTLPPETAPANPSVLITDGNLGGIEVGSRMYYFAALTKADILVNRGNLGGVQAGELGVDDGTLFGGGPNFSARGGSIGLLRSDAAFGTINYVEARQINGNGIGGDIQVMAVPGGAMYLNAHADRRIGTIMCTSLTSDPVASVIEVNADRRRNDGVIDLISVVEDMGTISAGGPQITTNNGNVRYIHVGGQIFRDSFFGGNAPEETQFLQGQEAFFTDDSGAQITLTPTQSVLLDATGQPVLGTDGLPIDTSGTLTVTTYPIRRRLGSGLGGGGSVIVRVATSAGVTVRATSAGRNGTAEIGELQVNGAGAGLITDPGPDGVPNTGDEDLGPDGIANSGDEPLIINPNSQNINDVLIRNNARNGAAATRVDVYSIVGTDLNSIRNTSRGEIVNVDATTIGLLEGGNIGIARNNTGADLYGVPLATPRATTFPFLDQRYGIVTTGAISQMFAYQGIGNIMAGGIVFDMRANSDKQFEKGVFEGIAAPVYTQDSLRFLDIGEGILPSGTGSGSNAGVYVHNRLDRLVNQGLGSDIRGDVVAFDSIGRIDLTDGAIINADFHVSNSNTAEDGSDFVNSREIPTGGVINSDPGDPTVGKIDAINVTGRGGIIGAYFAASNMGRVTVSGGFGIISTYVTTLGSGRIEATTASGYGVRNSFWQGGSFIDSVSATGTGKSLPVTQFSPSVRLSETQKFDPYFGFQPSVQTDLHTYLGTSANKPKRIGHTDAGAIENTRWVASRDLGVMTAHTMRGVLLSFGNQIQQVHSRTSITDMDVTAGRFDVLDTGGDLSSSEIGVGGPMGDFHIGGALRGSSALLATGPDGTINNLVVDGSLFADVEAEIGIGTIRVGQNIGSPNVHSGGDIDLIIVDGSLLNGSSITAVKDINQLVVGGDIQEDAFVSARDIKKKTVKGAQLGTVEETPIT